MARLLLTMPLLLATLSGCSLDKTLETVNAHLPAQLQFIEEKQPEGPTRAETVPLTEAPAALEQTPSQVPPASNTGAPAVPYDVPKSADPVELSEDAVLLRGKIQTADSLFEDARAEQAYQDANTTAVELAPPAIFANQLQLTPAEAQRQTP